MRQYLEGRTELTVMLELLVKQMPSKRFKSPLDACRVFLIDNRVDVGEALAHVRAACQAFEALDDPTASCPLQQSITLRCLFEERDKDHSGLLDFDELSALLRRGNPAMPQSHISTLFGLADRTGDGSVDFNEFVGLIFEDQGNPTSEEIKSEFRGRDTDGSGTLDREELSELLKVGNPKITDSEISSLFAHADIDKNGSIDFNEFIDFIYAGSNKVGISNAATASTHSRPSKESCAW